MKVLVTVGSTQFDSLVSAVLSTEVLDELKHKGYSQIVIQAGNSTIPSCFDVEITNMINDMEVEIWRFKPSLSRDIEQADFVISHAGSGTIIDVLRTPRPLIVVPNTSLLDNHQEELAQALHERRYLRAATVQNLATVIQNFETSDIIPFPPFDGGKFRLLVDEVLGV